MTLEELKTQMAVAVDKFKATGDMTDIQTASNAMNKAKAELAKEQATKLQKEAEQLAGKREAAEKQIFSAVSTGQPLPNIDKLLVDVKARGFNFYVKTTYQVPGQPEVHQQPSCGLILTQVAKVHKAGGGTTGKSKDEYGLSLSEIVEKFGTVEEQSAIANADNNSKSWQLKVAVKKRAIAEGKLPPVK